MIVACRNKNTDEILATKVLPISTRTEVYVPLRFAADKLKQFQADALSGQVVMDFYYHYRSVSTAKGTLEIKGDKNISIAVRDVVGSRSGKEMKQGDLTGMPVFMDEKTRIDRSVQARLERIINVEHKDVLPILEAQTPLLVDRLLASEDERGLDYDTLARKFKNQEFDLQLASYLKPQLVRLNSTKTESDATIDIKEDEQSKIRAGGGGFTLLLIGFGQASNEERERALKRIEKATGVTLAKTKDEALYRPHNIRIWRVREGWDRVEFNEKTVVYIPIGKETQYLVTSGVPTSFTEKVAEQNGQVAKDREIFSGVRRGMILPYCGKELPEGFVWADGKTNWPNEDWVPAHLRGTPVPNMEGHLIGGTSDNTLVGTRFTSGTIEIEKKSVAGSTFTLPDLKTLRVSPGVGSHKEGGWVGAFIRNTNYPPEKGGPNYFAQPEKVMAFGGYMGAEPAEYKGYDSKPGISGNVDLTWNPIKLTDAKTLPIHYMTRWVICIR